MTRLEAVTPAPRYRKVARTELQRASWGVMVCFLVHGLIVSSWVSRIAAIKSTLRLTDGALGLALLGTAIGSIAAIPVTGALVDRYGSRRLTKWTSVGFSIALLLPALSHNGIGLFAALLAFGAMAGANDVAMNAQAVGTEKLSGVPMMSRFHAMFSIGGIAGAGIGGLLASRGISSLAHLVFAAAGLLILANLAQGFTLETRNGEALQAGISLRRLPIGLIALSAIGFCIFLSEGAIADWTGVYLKQVLRASDGTAAAGYAVFSAAMAVFRLGGDAITARIGRSWTIRGGALIATAGLGLVVAAGSVAWALAGFAAAGAGLSSIIPLVFAGGGRVPSVSEGAGVATVSGLGYLGFLVGPPAIGFISQATSLRAGLFFLVLLSAAAALLVSVVERGSRHASNPLAD
ncbi:MAG TPA: MFS transporter [Bryobacteraceae bacterium]|nr:MFS transporter [Bryobacteraceae bacterium]